MKVSCDVWQTKHRAFILLTTALISGISVVRAYAQDDTKSITVYVDPGVSYNQNVGAGFDLIEKEATVLNIHLAISKGTIIESHLISVASGANWSKVSGSETDWQCAGVGPNDDFWCVIMCLIGGPGEGGPTYRWMSVSDVDVDADTDNNNLNTSHHPPSRSEDEDHCEYPGVSAEDIIGLIVPVNDDNDVNWEERDGGPPMNRDEDPDVLDFVLEIHPKRDGEWSTTFSDVYQCLSDGTSITGADTSLDIDEFVTLDLRLESWYTATSGTKSTGSAYFMPNSPSAGYVPRDRMKYLFLGCDIDVDSDNNGSIDGSNGAGSGEDFLEVHPQDHSYYLLEPECKYGMLVCVNDDDDDANDNPDNGWDGVDWDGPDGSTVQGDLDKGDLYPLTLRGLGVSETDKAVLDTMTPGLRIRKESGDGAVRLFTDGQFVEVGTFVNNGDYEYMLAGQSLWYWLSNQDRKFWVEGLVSGEVILVYELYLNQCMVHQDKVRLTVMKVDLDIDSDNNNGFGAPGRTFDEDQIEDKSGDANYPGKIVVVNDNDDDNDGIPDFADGFNQFGGTSNQTAGEDFVPLVLELPEPIDLTKAKLKITYSDSDPGGVTRTGSGTQAVYTPASGHLRIWTKDGAVARNKVSVQAGTPGDYVPSDTYEDISKLGFSGATRVVTLYVEGITNSAAVADQQIKVEVDPDGSGSVGFLCGDAVRMTVIQIDLKEVSFSGSDYYEVRKDDDSDDYDAPHWQDNSSPLDGDADDAGDRKYPVAYTRNKKATVEARFHVEPVPSGVTIHIAADGPGNLDVLKSGGSVSGNTVTLSAKELSNAFNNTVDYLNPLRLEWKVSFDNGTSWCNNAISENEVFVVLGVPGCAIRFRTMMYLACRNTGGTDSSSCLANTWSSFGGPANACAWDESTKTYSRPLHYYENSTGNGNVYAAALLADGNGQCHAWAHLFKECLLVNNVGSQRTRVTPPAGYDGFGVKNIVFDDANPQYPTDDPWKYATSDLDIEPPPVEAAGLAGQNMTTPKAKLFSQHFIVHPSGTSTYYDPSYGMTTSGASSYTASAVDAWEDEIGGASHWRQTSSNPAVDVVFTDESW